jgi:hypothetical protein
MNNRVVKGGDFDRWDIQNRIGPFASARSLLTIEEHGMGKQYLKLKRKLIISWIGVLIFAVLGVISYYAYSNQAMVSFSFMSLMAILLALRVIADASYTVASLEIAVRNLPAGTDHKKSGITKDKQGIHQIKTETEFAMSETGLTKPGIEKASYE